MTILIPYPADTRAKGWRFELDYERVRQSDTWALTPAEYRPWLLMFWMVAWEQTPCGSMPSDDGLICARIGMTPKSFAKAKPSLMRGWWLAEDGRLYHKIITERVLEMMDWRRKEAERKRGNRGKAPDTAKIPAPVPRDTTVTDDTGTGTGTGTIPSLRSGSAPATPGEACKAMKSAGLQGVNPSHPKLLALLEAGITAPELADAADHAVQNQKPFAYALATAEGRRRDSVTAALPAAGNKQEALEASNAAIAARFLEGQTHAAH